MCKEVEDDNSLETSQLDVISCGLGAAALLAIVFSVVKDIPPVNLSAPPFVKLICATDQKESELAFLVQPPGVSKPILIHAHQFFDDMGQLLSGKTLPLQQYGELRIQRTVNEVDQVTTNLFASTLSPPIKLDAQYMVKVDNPVEGQWRFNVVYSNQSTDAWNQILASGNVNTVQLFTISDTRHDGMRQQLHDTKLSLIDRQLRDWIEIDVK